MKKRKKKSRSLQMLRNCFFALILTVLLWVLDEFPPLTKQGVARAVLGDHLMNEGEIIWEETNWNGYETMYLLSGDTVIRTPYYLGLMRYFRWVSDILYGSDGVTCIPSTGVPGEFLVMGRFPEAVSAVLELRMGRERHQEKDLEYTAEGNWRTDKVISFVIPETYEGDADFFANTLRKVSYQEGYYDYTLTLYDASGNPVGVWTNLAEQEAARQNPIPA